MLLNKGLNINTVRDVIAGLLIMLPVFLVVFGYVILRGVTWG